MHPSCQEVGTPQGRKKVYAQGGMPFIGFVSFYSTVDEVWSLHQEIEVKYYSLGLNRFCLISLWQEADSVLSKVRR